jgi:hypothetical protein
MSERRLRMGEWNNRKQWIWKSEGVTRRFKTSRTHRYIYSIVWLRNLVAHIKGGTKTEVV